MYFLRASSALAFFAALTLVSATVPVTYDNTYDNKGGSLSTVACSNGENGLLTKGFTTFGSLPKWPYIGGSHEVAAWNSPNCGTCWELKYKGNKINVLAVDHAANGFNIAQQALDKLTNGQAVDLGNINAEATKVPAWVCGL